MARRPAGLERFSGYYGKCGDCLGANGRKTAPRPSSASANIERHHFLHFNEVHTALPNFH
jgi:hypothetical protein